MDEDAVGPEADFWAAGLRSLGRPLGGSPAELPDTPQGRLARRVRQRRVERRWSQAELAAEMSRLGHPWHQTTVAKTERGERDPRFSELLDLARALDIKVERLVELDSPPDDLHGLEQEEQLVKLRLTYLDRDLANLHRQREALTERLAQLEGEIWVARQEHQTRNRA